MSSVREVLEFLGLAAISETLQAENVVKRSRGAEIGSLPRRASTLDGRHQRDLIRPEDRIARVLCQRSRNLWAGRQHSISDQRRVSFLLYRGYYEAERRSLARLAFNPNAPALRLHQTLGDGESQPRASRPMLIPGPRSIGPP